MDWMLSYSNGTVFVMIKYRSKKLAIGQISILVSGGEIMNIQIFGSKKCQETRKAERYFKDRSIKFQFINLAEKGLSKGELNSVKAAVGGIDALVDKEGKQYQKRNLKYILHTLEEELLNDPLLLKTPIVRNGSKATIGYAPEIWKTWD